MSNEIMIPAVAPSRPRFTTLSPEKEAEYAAQDEAEKIGRQAVEQYFEKEFGKGFEHIRLNWHWGSGGYDNNYQLAVHYTHPRGYQKVQLCRFKRGEKLILTDKHRQKISDAIKDVTEYLARRDNQWARESQAEQIIKDLRSKMNLGVEFKRSGTQITLVRNGVSLNINRNKTLGDAYLEDSIDRHPKVSDLYEKAMQTRVAADELRPLAKTVIEAIPFEYWD